MGNILIYVSAYSEDWCKSAIAELVNSDKVKFLYTDHAKYKEEISKITKLGNLMKILIQQGKTLNIDPYICGEHINNLESNAAWIKEEACDDPHLFSMVYLKQAPFVLTADKRLTKCRKCIRATMDRRYGNFVAIRTREIYLRLKGRIMR